MQISIDDVKVKSDKVLQRIRTYLLNVSDYQNADLSMRFRVYAVADNDNDFIGLESCKYNMNFVSNSYKISDILNRLLNVCECSFAELLAHFNGMSQ